MAQPAQPTQPTQPQSPSGPGAAGAPVSLDDIVKYFNPASSPAGVQATDVVNYRDSYLFGDTNRLNSAFAGIRAAGITNISEVVALSDYAAAQKMSPDQLFGQVLAPGVTQLRMNNNPIVADVLAKAIQTSSSGAALGVNLGNLNIKQANAILTEYGAPVGQALEAFNKIVMDGGAITNVVNPTSPLTNTLATATTPTQYVAGKDLTPAAKAALGQIANAAAIAADKVATKIAAGSAENPSNLRLNRTVLGMLTAPASSGQAEGGFFSNFGLNGGLFYNHSEMDNDIGAIQTFGTELGGSMGGDRFLASVTVPLYYTWMPKAWGDSFAYGIDVAASYEVLKGLRLGVNGNIINNDTDMFNSRFSWQVGPTVAYGIAINDRFHVNLGTIFNYGGIESGEETWMSGYGIGLGVKLTDKLTLTPYYAYYRDLDALSGFDPDWHDAGLQLNAQITPKWSFAGGAKTSLGEHIGTIKVDYNINVYLSTCYKF